MEVTVIINLILIIATLICIICFLVLNHRHPTSLFTGLAFLIVISALSFDLFAFISQINEQVAFYAVLPIILVFLFIAIFWFVILVISVIINTRIMLKRERKSIANFLPIIALTAFIIINIVLWLLERYFGDSSYIKAFIAFSTGTIYYFILVFLLYAFTAMMYKYMPNFGRKYYIVILGAGLYNDRVTPLLAGRIDAGISFYKKQVKRKKHKPTIILSGGQGADENISEARAMNNYIIETYGDDFPIYLEEKSTTTLENIKFSEQIAQERDGINNFKDTKIALATSGYHLLRAGKIAQTLDIPAYGVGGKTRFYYIPTAFIREFIGYLSLKKRIHIIAVSVIFLASCILLF